MKAVGGWHRIDRLWHRIAVAERVPHDYERRTRVVTACRLVVLAWPKDKVGYGPLAGTRVCSKCESIMPIETKEATHGEGTLAGEGDGPGQGHPQGS